MAEQVGGRNRRGRGGGERRWRVRPRSRTVRSGSRSGATGRRTTCGSG